jgi:hypothetical protein
MDLPTWLLFLPAAIAISVWQLWLPWRGVRNRGNKGGGSLVRKRRFLQEAAKFVVL